jgi:signal-transduction protein with cAMP-binding, CBS, and nucleotidyltransferase domain
MPNQKKVREVMIPLEDYPHIPQWFTLRQAVAIVRESAIKYAGVFSPRAVLVFSKDHQLVGILTLRALLKGLKPDFLRSDVPFATDMDDVLGPDIKKQAERPVSEVMAPVRASVQADDSLVRAMFLIIKENVGTMPVMEEGRVLGMVRLTELFLEVSQAILAKTADEVP